MCQFSSESNEQMEPNDNQELSGLTGEEKVVSSISHAVNPEHGIVQKDASSTLEEPSLGPPKSLASCESSASISSEYSVDVNPYSDGHTREDGHGSESGFEDPRYRLYQARLYQAPEQLHDVKENHEEDKNGLMLENLDSHVTNSEGGTSSDESFDEADVSTPTFYERDEIWDPPEAENANDDIANSVGFDVEEYANADSSEWGNPRSKEIELARENVKNEKFKDLVSQLLSKLGVEICNDKDENWVDIVTDLAWQAAKFVEPGVTEGKAMDPFGYVKIKCVAAGSPKESQLIKGLVFKKHAAHKHMITNYTNPRLLLIQGMLGPSSVSSGLSSFSSMISEDEVNWGELMQNLQACQPNVILVEKSASRAVMEKILQMGVTLVLDMKLDRLERIARCINSPILSCDSPFNQELKHCTELYFEKFVEEHTIVAEGGKKPSKTLMFVVGSPTRLGCTILLKGSHAEELKKIKCVVQCAVVMAYHFLLETSFLLDQKSMFSTIASGKAADISSTNEQSTSVVSEHSSIPHSEEPNLGDLPADGVQVLISDGDDQASSYERAAHDIMASNEVQEGESFHAKEFTAKDAEIASPRGSHDKLSHNMQFAADCQLPPKLSVASRAFSNAPEILSTVSPATYEHMSTYMDLNGRELEAQTAVSIPVSPTEDPAERSDIEAKNLAKEDNSIYNDSQPVSTSSTAEGAKGPADDGEESITAKDEISSVLDSESILVLMSRRNAIKGTICEQSHFSQIKFYRNFDVPLGKFLRDNLFNQDLNCETCGQGPEAHYYYYAHHSKQLTIRVKQLGDKHLPREPEGKLWMWSRCSKCEPDKEKATKRVLISDAARCLSFGKFLELSFSSHSSFNRLAGCGHSFQKDFLYFFGLGSMVAMFQYSRVAIYTVSVPAHKLEFNSLIDRDWLQSDIGTVYTSGLCLFNELEKYLKKIESRFSGCNLVLNGYSKGFADIVDMLKLEKSEFEENFKNKNEDSHDSVHKLLSMNRLRWEIMLEACIWDRRLQSLLSSSREFPQSTVTDNNEVAQRQLGLKEDGFPGKVTEESKTAAETAQKQMLLEKHRSGTEGEMIQKIADNDSQALVDSEKEHSDGTVETTTKVVERQTGSNNGGAEEIGVQRTEDGHSNLKIENEVIAHGYDRTSENPNDVEVQIEMVAETENHLDKEFPNEGILVCRGEQDLISLPIVEENTVMPPSDDLVSSISLSQESNGSTDLPSHLHSDEITQQDSVSLSSHLSEDRSISIDADKEDSSCSADGEVSERITSLLKLDSPWWNPFKQTRNECMEDLLEGRPSKFGHLPKFELLHSPDFLPTVSQVIIDEGTRIHMPLRDGDFIVSDFDGEISSSVACALALMEISAPPASIRDEFTSLKRATSEPWPLSSFHDPDFIHSSSSMTFTESHLSSIDSLNRVDSLVSYGRVYNEVILGIEKYPMKGKYSVVIIHPTEFRDLRERCCPSELDYIASLSRCKIWDAKGGKSKSVFAKTLDERLIVKEIKKTEFESFMKFANEYFKHMKESVYSGNQTCLAKILGIYQVTIRNPKSGKETKHDLMVQENLSFGRNITRQYDLKGALHARFTTTADGAGDVLLDQNFVNDMNSSPLYVGQKAKRLLQRAVWNDTTFLKNIGVMDYSLLVGVDRQRRELICGIIDYLRQYTWDKQFETWVKSSLVVPKNSSPTIISPQEYKKRFRKFMDTHFLTVPDHWCSNRSSNPCKLCGVKVHDISVTKSEKQEELIGVPTQEKRKEELDSLPTQD
ncbi:putative 1-phosphatidylinositol-3-phosphate 5-kinase FAB1D [Chenopodium quinoa]|uniref:1-phosphatidylinositol-3-phosphate 5-kinase n=1 Tax=Chenopodium quinoa TaxID=63459 RepID=A0A803M574_CHEQI|nr:putative 1-phosphatidylinositol-3-phosphate 5-kinase FAB1D [Chenopodium quinoa]XP_021760480.1 putative 1-phosphatidylinositol-3-phosphate 5-kinase FAB1D [Chenopodium quinoa]